MALQTCPPGVLWALLRQTGKGPLACLASPPPSPCLSLMQSPTRLSKLVIFFSSLATGSPTLSLFGIHRSCEWEIPVRHWGSTLLGSPRAEAGRSGPAPCPLWEASDNCSQGSGPPWGCESSEEDKVRRFCGLPGGEPFGELGGRTVLSLARGTVAFRL